MKLKKSKWDLALAENLSNVIYVLFKFKKHRYLYRGHFVPGIAGNQLQDILLYLVSFSFIFILWDINMSQSELYQATGLLGILVLDVGSLILPLLLGYKLMMITHLLRVRHKILHDQIRVTYNKSDVVRVREQHKYNFFRYNNNLEMFMIDDQQAFVNPWMFASGTERTAYTRNALLKTGIVYGGFGLLIIIAFSS